jgi:hypothetical protein
LLSGEYTIPDGPLFTVKNYLDTQHDPTIDPFQELREACEALEKPKSKQKLPHPPPSTADQNTKLLVLAFAVILFIILIILTATSR